MPTPPTKQMPTSVVIPKDLLDNIKRACARQGCSMKFKIVEALRTWEKDFLERERQQGRGQVS